MDQEPDQEREKDFRTGTCSISSVIRRKGDEETVDGDWVWVAGDVDLDRRRTCAPPDKDSEPMENVRIVLTVENRDEDPASFRLVTAGGRVKMDNLAGYVEIDGNKNPIILRLEAKLCEIAEDEYQVECTYGVSRPVVVGSAATNEGPSRSTFQYRDIAVSATLRIKVGESVVFLEDPEKRVTLGLESVGE
jgi:hypothetical protein